MMNKNSIEKEIASIAGLLKSEFENTPTNDTSKLVELGADLYKKLAVWEYLKQVPVIEQPVIETPVIHKIVEERIPETSIPDVQHIQKEIVVEIIAKPVVESTIYIQAPAAVEKMEESQPVQPEIKTASAFDIKKHVGFNDKFEFINELFKGNSANYETCISQLNSSTSLKQALTTFYNFKTAYGWAEDNESAAKLQEIIQIAFK